MVHWCLPYFAPISGKNEVFWSKKSVTLREGFAQTVKSAVIWGVVPVVVREAKSSYNFNSG